MVIAQENVHRHQAMEALAKFSDPNGAAAIATRLAHGGDRALSSKLLKSMGPKVAEVPVAQLMLGTKDRDTRFAAVHVLAEIGTRQCIGALQQVGNFHKKDGPFVKAVTSALQACQGR